MSAHPTLDVVLIDDVAHFRRGVASVLEQEPGIAVVGEAGDGPEALKIVERSAPDVALVDLRMPGMSGLDVITGIRLASPVTRVLVLTVSDDDGDLFDAILRGAHGYLLKDTSIEAIPTAIRAVACGGAPLSPAMAARLVERCASMFRAVEAQVLELFSHGASDVEIATSLSMSTVTVASHLRNALDKVHLQAWLSDHGVQLL